MICPYCRTEEEGEIEICSGCKVHYHQDCFVESESCVIPGCSSLSAPASPGGQVHESTLNSAFTSPNVSLPRRVAPSQTTAQHRFCGQCGSPSRGGNFCGKCGNSVKF